MEFGSILFHKYPDSFTDDEREEVIDKLKEVLKEYGLEFDEYQFAGYNNETHPISKCVRCGDLTLDVKLNEREMETGDIFDSISRVLQRGEFTNGQCLCYECKKWMNT